MVEPKAVCWAAKKAVASAAMTADSWVVRLDGMMAGELVAWMAD